MKKLITPPPHPEKDTVVYVLEKKNNASIGENSNLNHISLNQKNLV